jgi:MarR family 2-MHQ and catechol resistance regulon transcriptional repressor
MGTKYQGSKRQQRALNAFIPLTRCTETLTSQLAARLKQHRLSVTQFGTLEVLLHLGPMTQCQVARKLLKTSGNMTTVIDHLVRDGLVERQPGRDRRSHSLVLTSAGRELVERVLPEHVEQITDAMDALTASEQETLRRLCRKLGTSLKNRSTNHKGTTP